MAACPAKLPPAPAPHALPPDSSGCQPHLLGQVASALWRVENLVVEHAEVERQAQADGVRGRQVHQRDVLHGSVGWQQRASQAG